nr:venom polypeptide precursor [Doratifera vulnerans]
MDYRIVTVLALFLSAALSSPTDAGPICPCLRLYDPLCASDGKSYNSKCEFDCTQSYVKQKYGKDIYVLKQGKCDEY